MKTVMYVLYLFVFLSWLSAAAGVYFACRCNWGPAVFFLLAAQFTRGVVTDAADGAMQRINEAFEDGLEAGEIMDEL